MQNPGYYCCGDFVAERGSGVLGRILGPGVFPHEWRVKCTDGHETICLAENLVPCRIEHWLDAKFGAAHRPREVTRARSGA